MDTTEISWLAGIFVGSITINRTLIFGIKKGNTRSPNLLAGIFNLLYSVGMTAFAFFIFTNKVYALLVLPICVPFYLVTYFEIKNRDNKGLRLGSDLLTVFHKIELQIAFLSSLVAQGGQTDLIITAADNSIDYALDQLHEFLTGGNVDRSILSLLSAENNGDFRAIASKNITPNCRTQIEAILKHGANSNGIAGQVVNSHLPICIPDLSDEEDQNTTHWVSVPPFTDKKGSLVCFPINEGIGQPNANTRTTAVLNLSCSEPNKFTCKTVLDILTRFCVKIEILLNMRNAA